MKRKRIVPGAAAILAIAAMIPAFAPISRADEDEGDQTISAKSSVTYTNGAAVIHLDLKAQQLAGVQTVAVSATTLPLDMKAYGNVLDPAALISLRGQFVAARAALQASRSEYERLKKLSVQDNTSAHALQTAEAEMERDQGALETAGAQLIGASCQTIADEPADFFQSLMGRKSALVRLDLPAGEISDGAPTAAILAPPGNEPPVAAGFLGRTATIDPQTQGEGFIFLVTNAPASLISGLSLTGFLQLPGRPLSGVIVPDDAVVRSAGHAWIYAQTGETDFERREIVLDHPTASGWFVTNGITAGEKIIVTGAQTLLSEEQKSQIKLED